jgi:hypothetical protein
MKLKSFFRSILLLLITISPFSYAAIKDSYPTKHIPHYVIPKNNQEMQRCRYKLKQNCSSNKKIMNQFDIWSHDLLLHKKNNKNFNLHKVLIAVEFAAAKHNNQFRRDINKTPYIINPISVAYILWDEAKIYDEDIIIAALLHNTLEDTDTTKAEIKEKFGKTVACIAEELTNDSNHNGKIKSEKVGAMSRQSKLIKLADRIYNVRDLNISPPISWNHEKTQTYFYFSNQLLQKMKGTNAVLEGKLSKEISLNNNF